MCKNIPKLKPDTIARFWAQVDVTDDDSECWEWIGYKNKDGYGVFGLGESKFLAPRVAHYIHNDMNLEGITCCHTCDNPVCCNPAHLWLGSQGDNLRDMFAKGRADPRGKKKRLSKCITTMKKR